MEREAVVIAILWGIGIPLGLSLIFALFRALWALKRGDRKAARRLALFGWADNIRSMLRDMYEDEEESLRAWALLIIFVSVIVAAVIVVNKEGVTWKACGVVAFFTATGIPLMVAHYTIGLVGRLSRTLRIAATFHVLTQNKFRRIYPVPELTPLIKEFKANKGFRFMYRLARVDNAKGGFWGTGDLLSGLLKTERASLWELERYHLALKWTIERHITMGSITDAEIDRYKEVIDLFEKGMFGARLMLEDMRTHDQIIGSMDLASRQVKIAFWSAMGSIASAIAAFMAAIIALAR